MIVITLLGIYLITSLLLGFALARTAADADRRIEQMHWELRQATPVEETSSETFKNEPLALPLTSSHRVGYTLYESL